MVYTSFHNVCEIVVEELSQSLSQTNNDENLVESETSQDEQSQSRTGSQVHEVRKKNLIYIYMYI